MSNGPKTGITETCGIDEAGRGPLAGPVTAAAVVLPADFSLIGLNDSKKLSPARRAALRSALVDGGALFGLGHADHAEIDRLNIHHATLLAMWRAWISLCTAHPEVEGAAVLVDGRFCPKIEAPCRAVVDGDATEPAIMAASILAKTERDRIMLAYHARWPGYGFDRNKGYPTSEHRRAIRAYGASPIHRRSFRGVDVGVGPAAPAAPAAPADDDLPDRPAAEDDDRQGAIAP